MHSRALNKLKDKIIESAMVQLKEITAQVHCAIKIVSKDAQSEDL